MENEKQYYELKDVQNLQRKKLHDIGVPDSEIEEKRKLLIKYAVDILNKTAAKFEALSVKLNMTECLNEEDFAQIWELFGAKLPINNISSDDDKRLIKFLTLTREEELYMVMSK